MRLREIGIGLLLVAVLAGGIALSVPAPQPVAAASAPVPGVLPTAALAPAPGETDSTARGIPYGAALVACRLGADCGRGALRTLALRVQQGWCADTVPAALQQGLGLHFAPLDRLVGKAVGDPRCGDSCDLRLKE